MHKIAKPSSLSATLQRYAIAIALSSIAGCRGGAADAESSSNEAADPQTIEPQVAPDPPRSQPPFEGLTPSDANDAVVETDRWLPCDEDAVLAVRSFPLRPPAVAADLGGAIDGGAFARATGVLDPDAPLNGTWSCDPSDGLRMRFHVVIAGVDVPAIWGVPPADADGVRRADLEPLNWMAAATMTEEALDRSAVESALDSFQRCRLAGGARAVSGVFAWLQDRQATGALHEGGWLAFPERTVGEHLAWRVVVHWRLESIGNEHATWIVEPWRSGCAPGDENAAQMAELAAAVVPVATSIRPRRPEAVPQPWRDGDPQRRALLYVLSEESELRTLDDWLSIHSRLRPVSNVDWSVEPGETGAHWTVALTFALGEERAAFGWSVDAVSGDPTPLTPAATTLRLAHPVRRPGEGMGPNAPDDRAINSAVQPRLRSLSRCVGDAGGQIAMSLRWDGGAFGARVVGGTALEHADACVTAALRGLEFPSFSGPARDVTLTVGSP